MLPNTASFTLETPLWPHGFVLAYFVKKYFNELCMVEFGKGQEELNSYKLENTQFSQDTLSIFKVWPKVTKKNPVFLAHFQLFLKFKPLPSTIFWINHKFYLTPMYDNSPSMGSLNFA